MRNALVGIKQLTFEDGESFMKKLSAVFMILLFSVSAGSVFAETYNGTTNGMALSLTIAPRAYAIAGKSEIRAPGIWTYAREGVSLTNGIIYPMSWSNYERGSSGSLHENELSRGAMMAVMFAEPSASCADGAVITAFVEMPKAAGISNPGAEITVTPVSGFICGAPITSFKTYVLALLTTVNNTAANISGSKTKTSTATNFDFSGSYKVIASIPTTMSLKQTGSTLTGTVNQPLNTLTLSGTVSGGTAEIKVASSGINCTGSGSGKIFYLYTDNGITKILLDLKADPASTCGGTVAGVSTKQ